MCDVGSVGQLQQGPLLSGQSVADPPDSTARVQQEIETLRLELEGDRELLQLHVGLLVQQNREQLDL